MSLYIWAHMSIAWWIWNSYKRSHDIWWNAFQIFSKSPRWWNFVNDSISDDIVNECKGNSKDFNQQWSIIHSVYLVNLAKPNYESEKDINSVIDDFKIANKLWINWVNVHLWKYWDQTKEQAMNNMTENLKIILDNVKQYWIKFVFENTAWQWTEIWRKFSELWEFIRLLEKSLWKDLISENIRVCFDTAHAWWAWYDLNNFDRVLAEFDSEIWLDKLFCFHLNDSKAILGSKLDRHASFWRWFIWVSPLLKVVDFAYKNNIPLILETPEPDLRSDEINMIKWFLDWTYKESFFVEFNNKHFKTQYLNKFKDYAINDNVLF